MVHRFDTVSFLSDYGHADEFVGVVKSVIRDLAPHVTVIDLLHEVPPFDVRAGGLALARCIQYVAPGVVLAVVDPGVGTDRKAIAVEVADGAGVLVGPDNGVLAPAVAMAGGAGRAVELSNPDYQIEAPGATFAGRDVFAPAAAHLCTGVDMADLGPPLDTALLTPGLVPVPREEEGELVAEVLWVDRFGNAQLNVDPEAVEEMGDVITVTLGSERRSMPLVAAFAELGPGQFGLVLDSYGLLAITADRQSAADELDLATGTEVRLSGAT
jgi:S-adenosyl-L-methionine hydrolase (adenosine-forming)